MPPKRDDRVAPPPPPGGWDIRYAANEAIDGFLDLGARMPGPTREAWLQLGADPRHHTARQHRMKGGLASGLFRGESFEQWEYEVTGAARIRYLIDDAKKTARLVEVNVGHPKDTE